MELSRQVIIKLNEELNRAKIPGNEELNSSLRLLAKWRSLLIQNTYLIKHGTKVFGGPFRGLDYIEQSAEGCHVAKLLGCYEQPLHPYIAEFLKRDYTRILHIGCAEGYYAVGLARYFTSAISMAFDTNPLARQACEHLAAKNNVNERMTIAGEFRPSDFKLLSEERALIFCDIEGSEYDIFKEAAITDLLRTDIIVESHECFHQGITERLVSMFTATHDITIVKDNGVRTLGKMPSWFESLSHLDQLLSVWEWRSGPTPWVIMEAKEGS
ncbi:MAG: hypothetical protein VXW45_01155 [Pseudomonadota bacterium]|nr:hypothetical protein [Pseudomonadota bacterium]